MSPPFPLLALGWRHSFASDCAPGSSPNCASSGIPEFDLSVEGIPRGRISEIVGPASSGRTTLLHSVLASASKRGEQCVLIDAASAFDPPSAAARGVALEKLIWIRCAGNTEHAMRAVDLVLRNGGFGVVALDLAEVGANALRRIPPTAWFRFRRAVESTPTIFLVVANQPLARSCASLQVETRRRRIQFLSGVEYEVIPRKPVGKEPGVFHVRLHSLAGS